MMSTDPGQGTRRTIYSGSDFERRQSCVRGVLTGGCFRLSGTTGFDYATDTLAQVGLFDPENRVEMDMDAVLHGSR